MTELYFWVFGFLIFSPLLLFKSFFLKMTILAYAYPIWLMSAYSLGLPVSRIMAVYGDKYYSMYYTEVFIIAMLSYVAFIGAIWNIRKKEYKFYIVRLPFVVRLLLLIFFVVFVVVAYPKVFGLSNHRFGSMGGVVIVLASVFIMTSSKSKDQKFLSLLFMSLIFFIVLNGERVDFILMLMTTYIFYKRESIVNLKIFGVIAFIGLLLAVVSGFLRSGQNLDLISILIVLPHILTNFGTAVDVIHVYMSSVWYYHNVGITVDPILNIFFSYIPLFGDRGVSSDLNFSKVLIPYIKNLGGGLFYSVGMMSMGAIGVILSGLLYGYLFKKLFISKGIYSLLFIAFFILQFRLQWYGFTYYSTPIILLTIIIFIIKKYLRSVSER
jgi:MFS family permease